MKWLSAIVCVGVFAALPLSCGHGGGGGGGKAAITYEPVTLEKVKFPDPSDQQGWRPGQGPSNCSLVQQVALTFSGPVNRDELTEDTLRIRDLSTSNQVPGSLRLSNKSRTLTFNPLLPVRPARLEGEQWDVGGASLFPDREYEIIMLVDGPGSLSTLTGIAPHLQERFDGTTAEKLVARFRTTAEPKLFWTGLPDRVPRLAATTPPDGSAAVSPHLFSDPDGRTEPLEAVELEFDTPLDPQPGNIKGIRLLDLADSKGRELGEELPVTITLVANEVRLGLVHVIPHGILPLGHRLGVTVPRDLRGLGGSARWDSGEDLVAGFAVWDDEGPVTDAVVGLFESRVFEDQEVSERPPSTLFALWDEQRSERLVAARSFPGEGELGRFIPEAGETEREIILRTDRQEFPLLDGSTPDVPFTVVEGGVFNFSRVFIPEGVVVRGVGPDPLVLTATGDVVIEGRIDVSGRAGETEGIVWDQGLSPLQGGVGGPDGGRGGDGHPLVLFDGRVPVSPRRGASGESPLAGFVGGRGGESGVVSDPPGMDCTTGSDSNSSRGGAGGGGVYLAATDKTKGLGTTGIGDVTSAEQLDVVGNQIYVPIDGGVPSGGAPGDSVFVDGNDTNDYIGLTGEYRHSIGGQGGGGGGSRLDSYHCASFSGGLPVTVMDARGGGGGGGGGVLEIRCLGRIVLRYTATNRSFPRVQALGGGGGYGEQPTISDRGGAGGGGAGGILRFISLGEFVLDDDLPGDSRFEALFVEGGKGGGLFGFEGGMGGAGLVQIELPPEVEFTPPSDFVRPERSLVPPEKTASELIPISVGQSKWVYLGAGVFRDDGTGPQFRFRGTNAKGDVETDAEGRVIGAETADFRVVTLARIDPLTGEVLEPEKPDYLAPNASVRIEFQGAMAKARDREKVDRNTITPWSPDISVADGHQFIRFRVTFDIARADRGYRLGPGLRTPALENLVMRFSF